MSQFMFDLGDERMNRFAMAVSEQPQQRLENFGTSAVSDTELLAMVMQGNGTRAEAAVSLATQLLAEAGSMAALLSWTSADYRRIKGIGSIKGLQLWAMAEIARRMMTVRPDAPPLLNEAGRIAAHFTPLTAGLEVYVELTIMWSRALENRSSMVGTGLSGSRQLSIIRAPRGMRSAASRAMAAGIVVLRQRRADGDNRF